MPSIHLCSYSYHLLLQSIQQSFCPILFIFFSFNFLLGLFRSKQMFDIKIPYRLNFVSQNTNLWYLCHIITQMLKVVESRNYFFGFLTAQYYMVVKLNQITYVFKILTQLVCCFISLPRFVPYYNLLLANVFVILQIVIF